MRITMEIKDELVKKLKREGTVTVDMMYVPRSQGFFIFEKEA